MSNDAAWLLLSFAIMVVAVLATLYEKVEQLEKRLRRFEAGGNQTMTNARRMPTAPSRRRRSGAATIASGELTC